MSSDYLVGIDVAIAGGVVSVCDHHSPEWFCWEEEWVAAVAAVAAAGTEDDDDPDAAAIAYGSLCGRIRVAISRAGDIRGDEEECRRLEAAAIAAGLVARATT